MIRYTVLMMNIKQIIKQKRKQILETAAKYGAYNVRLFGSIVRGDATETSDVDFLIQLEPRCKLFDWLHLEEDLESLFRQTRIRSTGRSHESKTRARALKEAVPL